MPKTDVILIQNVVGLGGESDQIKVSTGYARNYLVPHGLAIPLSQGNTRRLEALRQRRSDRENKDLSAMSELGKSLSQVTLTLLMKTGDDGKMFGSVTTGTIVDAIKTQLDVAIEKKKIILEKPIHALGEYEIAVNLHQEVKSSFKIIVKSSNPLPDVPAAPVVEVQKSEKRSRFGRRSDEARPSRKA